MFVVRHALDSKGNILIQDPPIAQFLFQSTKASVIRLVLRLWMSCAWFKVVWHKLTDSALMETGRGVLGHWQRTFVFPSEGRQPVTYGWYRSVVQFSIGSGSHLWFAKVRVFGELAVGPAVFVGIAAFFGAMMNMNFLLAGTVSTDPMLFFAGIFLILACEERRLSRPRRAPASGPRDALVAADARHGALGTRNHPARRPT